MTSYVLTLIIFALSIISIVLIFGNWRKIKRIKGLEEELKEQKRNILVLSKDFDDAIADTNLSKHID